MITRIRMGGLAAVVVAAGCGSGGGENPGSGTAYALAPAVLNSVRTYSETIVDNANNIIVIGFSQTVIGVPAAGTVGGVVTETQQSTTGVSDLVNGTDYEVNDETQTYNDGGEETAYTYTSTAGMYYACEYSPHGPGPDYPVKVGETWTLDYTFGCNSQTPVSYTQEGTVVDVESITVPAGTFDALKFQSTLTWTDLQGTTRTQTITNWRDIVTSHSVKQSITIAVSGVLPTVGYAVSRSIVLDSVS